MILPKMPEDRISCSQMLHLICGYYPLLWWTKKRGYVTSVINKPVSQSLAMADDWLTDID